MDYWNDGVVSFAFRLFQSCKSYDKTQIHILISTESVKLNHTCFTGQPVNGLPLVLVVLETYSANHLQNN